MKFIMNKFHYDEENDILYYTKADKSNSYGDEDPDNIVFMKDIETDIVTGITILNFVRMYQERDTRIKILSEYFNVGMIVQKLKTCI